MAASSSSSKQVMLVSSDGETFVVDEAVAVQSLTLKHMIEDGCADSDIPVPNVTGVMLSKVIEYCKRHTDSSLRTCELNAFDAEFVKVDQKTLFDIILAANYLNIKSLLDLACKTVAEMVRGLTVEEIRRLFNLKNDFTPEEEAKVRLENAWSFDHTTEDD